MIQVLEFLVHLISQGTKILMMTLTLFFMVQLQMILKTQTEKVMEVNKVESVVPVAWNLKYKTSGRRKTLERDMTKVKTDFLSNHCSQEVDPSLA